MMRPSSLDQLLGHRQAEAGDEAAVDLPLVHQRVDHGADVVRA